MQVLNIDTKPLDNPGVRTLIADITDSGQVFNALSTLYGLRTNSTRRCARSRSTRWSISPPSRAS